MPRGFQCADGWFDLVYRLCERLEPLVLALSATLPPGDRFEVLQAKQKMGELRFYVSHHNAAIDAETGAARMDSLRTCEHCGRPGTLRNKDGWLVVLCDECLGAKWGRTTGRRQIAANQQAAPDNSYMEPQTHCGYFRRKSLHRFGTLSHFVSFD
jgi:hypothetical protein